MINIYRDISGELQKCEGYHDDSWIEICSPSEEEIEKIVKKFEIPRDFLIDPLDLDEIARLEFDEEDFIVVLRIPVYDSRSKEAPFYTIPLGVIVIKNRLMITVCSRETKLILDFIKGNVRNFNPGNRDKFMLQIFSRAIQLYIRYIKQLRLLAEKTEAEIHESMKNRELIRLFKLEKCLIQASASLKSNYRVLQKLQRTGLVSLSEGELDLLEDVMIDAKQAIEMTDIYITILNEMMTFFSSLFSNNLNLVMKLLTAITIIIAIPTLISSVYGMNVKLPFQDSPHAFMITLGIGGLASLLGIILFFYRKWF